MSGRTSEQTLCLTRESSATACQSGPGTGDDVASVHESRYASLPLSEPAVSIIAIAEPTDTGFVSQPSDSRLNALLHDPAVERFDSTHQYGDGDVVVCMIYWHLWAIERALFGDFEAALRNESFEHVCRPILRPHVRELLKRPNAMLVLYNDWECRDLESHADRLLSFTEEHLRVPPDRVVFSTCNYLGHMQRRGRQVLSLDWRLVRAEDGRDRLRALPYRADGPTRLLSLNYRGNRERYAYCHYLASVHPARADFSYLEGSRPPGIDDLRSRLRWIRRHFRRRPWLALEHRLRALDRRLPRQFDGSNPDQHQTDTLEAPLRKAWFLMHFETNYEPVPSTAEQISEKSYKAIHVGRPFMLFTNKGGILAHLRAVGFQTFAPHIDESYDDPRLPYAARYTRLLRLTDRLCRMSDRQALELDRKLRPAVEHNLRHIRSPERVPPFLQLLVEPLRAAGTVARGGSR